MGRGDRRRWNRSGRGRAETRSLRDRRGRRGAAHVQIVRDLAAVGIALGQFLRDRRLADHVGWSVEHHCPSQVEPEIAGIIGRRSVEAATTTAIAAR